MQRSRVLKALVGAAVLAAALALSLATAAPQTESAPVPTPARRVVTAPVAPVTTAATLRFAATVRAERRARLGFTVPGRLVSRSVDAGDRVAAGAVLGRVESAQPANAVAAAEAALAELRARADQAERERARVERLAAAKAATGEELDAVRAAAVTAAAAVDRAVAELREARRRAAETVLTAPWAGTVTEVMADPGEYCKPGEAVLELAGDGALEAEIRVPESLLADLAPGAAVTVELPFRRGSGAGVPSVRGEVRAVGRAAGGGGRLFPVRIDLPAGAGLVPGESAEVLVRRAPGGALAVPLDAVLNPGGGRPAVFVVRQAEDGSTVAEKVPVEVDELAADGVAVRGDLAAGDRVIVAGHLSLIDGDAVEVAAQEVASPEVGTREAAR